MIINKTLIKSPSLTINMLSPRTTKCGRAGIHSPKHSFTSLHYMTSFNGIDFCLLTSLDRSLSR